MGHELPWCGFRGFSLESWVVGFLWNVWVERWCFSDMLLARTILAMDCGNSGSALSGRGSIGSNWDAGSSSRSKH